MPVDTRSPAQVSATIGDVTIAEVTVDGPVEVHGINDHGVAATANPVIVGGVARTAAPVQVDEGDAVESWHTREGAIVAAIVGTSGDGTPVRIEGDDLHGLDVDVTRIQEPVTAICLGVREHDTPIQGLNSDSPVLVGAYAKTTAPVPVSADGDAVRMWATREGALAIAVTGRDGSGTPVVIEGDDLHGLDVDVTRIQEPVTAICLGVREHDTPIQGLSSDSPVPIGGIAEAPDDSAPSNRVSAEGDAVRLACDLDGALYTHGHGPHVWNYATEHTLQATDAAVRVAPGAGLRLAITDIYIHCDGAVDVLIEDDTGVLLWKFYGQAAGDGATLHFRVPILVVANRAIRVDSSAAVTFFLRVNGQTVKGP
jgi:hypothetical protein